MDKAIELAQLDEENKFIFVNLVQFDSHYGHRRDVDGFASNVATLGLKTWQANSSNEKRWLINYD